ncbi:hypothetical protein [Myxococcus sp. AB025B]|uniref:hypothetical protein n=1 Tax=Myxococcus sp. AB025B TaxID=2562794 RepID=UPI001E31A797|nr:hypothetical protein [Myxococcus sp. AB025B]
MPFLIQLAREKGVSAYLGEGTNRWSAVHVSDAGRLYRLALEHGVGERVYHAIAEQGVAGLALILSTQPGGPERAEGRA